MKAQFKPLLLTLSLSAISLSAFAETSDDADLFDLSLEELISMDIPDVTSVSRKKQRLMDSAAAIYVITDNDIRRMGATSIPDALRMVPGMQVAKINGNSWSISTRGFNYIFANKLLVLIDGRTVYSPLFSGVNWDVQDTLMEDIDRIEVIRGPGAALWGANAVNGVINVITKKAADTQSTLVSFGGGNEEKAFAAYRHGGEFGETGFYKVFVKAFERDGQANADGSDAADDWNMRRAGFKTEWDTSKDSELTIQGDLYTGTTRPPLMTFVYGGDNPVDNLRTDASRDQRGGNLNGYWKRTFSDTHDLSFRAVYDNYQNFDYRVTEKRDTIDLEFQHYKQLWGKHDLVWGMGYRATWYEMADMRHIEYRYGDKRSDELYSVFMQDDITLNKNWTLTFSARYEQNDFTGSEFQPNAKVTWKATEDRTFWASLSRAVKTPSISETAVTSRGIIFYDESRLPQDILNISEPPYTLPISGNENLQSEKLTALEFGYREQLTPTLRIDTTVFVNHYDDLVAYVNNPNCGGLDHVTPIDLDPDPNVVREICVYDVAPSSGQYVFETPSSFGNGLSANTYGFEIVADWQARDWWKLQFTYSWLQVDGFRSETDASGYLAQNETLIETLSAPHTANIRSTMNLPNQWYFDTWLRYMDNMKNAGIGAHTALDVRIAKKYRDVEFSLVGQNLFTKQRQEFREIFSGLGQTEIQESWYAQIRWQF